MGVGVPRSPRAQSNSTLTVLFTIKNLLVNINVFLLLDDKLVYSLIYVLYVIFSQKKINQALIVVVGIY